MVKKDCVERLPAKVAGWAPVRAAAKVGWAAKGLAPAGNASAPSVGRGRLINVVSRATSSCARSVLRP